eukprot:scaffold1298_cov382-Prasinococcus_capsulatus_cf.AAC.19
MSVGWLEAAGSARARARTLCACPTTLTYPASGAGWRVHSREGSKAAFARRRGMACRHDELAARGHTMATLPAPLR